MDDLLNAFSEYMYLGKEVQLNKLRAEITISSDEELELLCKLLVMTRDYTTKPVEYEKSISELTPNIDF